MTAGDIYTIAGTGRAGLAVDGLLSAAAELSAPAGDFELSSVREDSRFSGAAG